jgi:hypothetical protein
MKTMSEVRARQQSFAGPSLSLFAVVVAFVATSCFDAHQVDPGVLMIDDFDHGAFPADATFVPWMCFAYNPSSNQNYSCAYDTDTYDGSKYSLRLDFEVADPVNLMMDYGGAGLATYAPFGLHQDLTAFTTLEFDARLESGIPVLPFGAKLNVAFGCSTARVTDGSAPGNLYVVANVDYDHNSDWGHVVVSLANFSFQSTDTRLIDGGVAGCLRLVDEMDINVEAELPDGASGAGTLNVDNIYLK